MNTIRKWIHVEGLPRMVQRVLFAVCGIIIICMARMLKEQVHYVVGVAALVISVLMLVNSIRNRTYDNREDRSIPTAAVGIALGIMILVRERNSIPFIAIAWGISGLGGGITELSHALYGMLHHEPFRVKLVHGLLETVLALLLVFDPHEKIGEHIVILGLEMLVQALAGTDEH